MRMGCKGIYEAYYERLFSENYDPAETWGNFSCGTERPTLAAGTLPGNA